MVSDPKCYNPKIVRHLNMANHRKMSQDVFRDRSLMQTICSSQRPSRLSQQSPGSGAGFIGFNYDEEERVVADQQTGLQTPI
ncbi:hypothetical protein WR25_01735 [Diploscapter pachys]|uniref:Uncharacterized protein n=1 Tax=Diploscapter pachys TaxID=2018661 RepID=A0A2A2LSD1_9BILA|nr:hypothetical protein WR25_01735 [Diploscapter pachys]